MYCFYSYDSILLDYSMSFVIEKKFSICFGSYFLKCKVFTESVVIFFIIWSVARIVSRFFV